MFLNLILTIKDYQYSPYDKCLPSSQLSKVLSELKLSIPKESGLYLNLVYISKEFINKVPCVKYMVILVKDYHYGNNHQRNKPKSKDSK